MKDFDVRILEPYLDSWHIDSLIGEGSFGYVFKTYKEEFGQKYYSALKVIALPKTEAEAKEVMYESKTTDTASQYFREIAEVITKEIEIMNELKGKTNIVNFEDHKIIKKENGIGYYILIRMELLTCLNDYLQEHTMSTQILHKLAIDLTKALQLCQQRNIIHRDIKPANIFISQDGEFKLGDFGIARQLEGVESGLSIKGTYTYMAPEVYKGLPYDKRVDIYSLGMVLYYFLNKKHPPFTNPNASVLRYGEKQDALRRRFMGEELPNPATGSRQFIQVVKKACAYKPENRYETADELLDALLAIRDLDNGAIEEPSRIVIKEESIGNVSDDDDKTVVQIQIPDDDDDEDEGTVMLTNSVSKTQSTISNPLKREISPEIENVSKQVSRPTIERVPNKNKKGWLIKLLFIPVIAIVLVGGFFVVKNVTHGIKKIVKTTGKKIEQVDKNNSSDENGKEYSVEGDNKGYRDFSKIDKLDKVTSLSLPNNLITSTLQLKECKTLTYLDLDSNKIEDLSGIDKLNKLKYLNLNNNQITDISSIKDLTSIDTLILSNNKITSINDLKEMTNLRELRLNGNKKLKSIAVIGNFTDLQFIDISNTKIKDITNLYKLKRLSVVIMKHTSVSKSQIKKLKKLLPDCTIVQ